jgi:hypothetical protein
MLLHLPTIKVGLRDAVATALRPLGVDCYEYAPDEPNVPCFYPAEGVIVPKTTMAGNAQLTLTCRVLASGAEDLDGQKLLDEMLSMSGDYSVWTALEAARGTPGQLALDGACDDLYMNRVDGYRMVPGPNESRWYGANLTILVIGSSS